MQFTMCGMSHRNLQKSVIVFLSNAARAGGVPQPPAPSLVDDAKEDPQTLARLRAWWLHHGDKAVLHDPWMPLLEKQKID
jgi:hypothetical protein